MTSRPLTHRRPSPMGEKGQEAAPCASPWTALLQWAVEAKRRLDEGTLDSIDEVATASAKLGTTERGQASHSAEEPR